MKTWFTHFKQGLSRKVPEDRISGHRNYGSPNVNLKNLLPYFKRHWRQALMGCLFVAAAALLAFAPPLITRYIVDDVILSRHVRSCSGVIAWGFIY